jgi:hypothetical protein
MTAPAMTSPVLASPLAGLPATAPAPVAVAMPAHSTTDLEWPQARSKKPLIIGAVGLVAVALVAWLLLSGSEEPSVPPSVGAPTEPARTPEAPPPEAPPPPATPPPTEPTQDQRQPSSAPDTPPTPNTGSAKGNDFADLFEKGAKGSR